MISSADHRGSWLGTGGEPGRRTVIPA